MGISIAKELVELNHSVVFVSSRYGGTPRGRAKELLAQHGYRTYLTSERGIRKSPLGWNFLFPLSIFLSLMESLYIFIKERPKGVIGTGSYGSFSMVVVAAMIGVPTIITEIDSAPGLVTKALSYIVSEVELSYLASLGCQLSTVNCQVTGCPVRKEISQLAVKIRSQDPKTENRRPKTVLIFGGSRGAYSLNMAFKEIWDMGCGMWDIQFIIATGRDDFEELSKCRSKNIVIKEFIDDMGSAYSRATLCVTRAGALTIGEITALGLPSILIPYPYATEGHQLKNAKILQQKGAASIILDTNLNGETLFKEIERIINNDTLRKKMAQASKRLGTPDAARQIASRIIELSSHQSNIKNQNAK